MRGPATARVLATRRDARPDAAALRRRLRGRDAGRRAMARPSRLGDVTVTFHPAGHVLGSAQIAVDLRRAPASSSPATTRTRRIRPARRSSRCPATSSSPRRPSACRCSAIGDAARRDRKAAGLGRAVSRARASGRRLFARQGAARDRAAARGRLGRADLPARRDGEDHATTTQSRGIALGELRPVKRRRARPSSPATIMLARRRPRPTSGRGSFPIR